MPVPSRSGWGNVPYGDGPWGDNPGVVGMSSDGNQLVQDTLSTTIFTSNFNTSILRMIINMSKTRTGITMTSAQNSYLQTHLIKIIESEGRTIPQTKQYLLAVKALKALQVL